MPEGIAPLLRVLLQLNLDLWGKYFSRGPAYALRSVVQGVINMVVAVSAFTTKVFSSEVGAWKFARPHIEGGANALGNIAYNELQAWTIMLHTILPNSLAWLDGRTHQWVDAKYDPQLNIIWHDIAAQNNWDDEIIRWANKFVAPNIFDWINFSKWWATWPLRAIATLGGWLAKPAEFDTWALPHFVPAMIRWLTDRKQKSMLDWLTGIVVDSTPDVAKHVEQAAVNILQTEGW